MSILINLTKYTYIIMEPVPRQRFVRDEFYNKRFLTRWINHSTTLI